MGLLIKRSSRRKTRTSLMLAGTAGTAVLGAGHAAKAATVSLQFDDGGYGGAYTIASAQTVGVSSVAAGNWNTVGGLLLRQSDDCQSA